MLVSAYIVERGLILEPYEVESKTNEIKALPTFIQHLHSECDTHGACEGVCVQESNHAAAFECRFLVELPQHCVDKRLPDLDLPARECPVSGIVVLGRPSP